MNLKNMILIENLIRDPLIKEYNKWLRDDTIR